MNDEIYQNLMILCCNCTAHYLGYGETDTSIINQIDDNVNMSYIKELLNCYTYLCMNIKEKYSFQYTPKEEKYSYDDVKTSYKEIIDPNKPVPVIGGILRDFVYILTYHIIKYINNESIVSSTINQLIYLLRLIKVVEEENNGILRGRNKIEKSILSYPFNKLFPIFTSCNNPKIKSNILELYNTILSHRCTSMEELNSTLQSKKVKDLFEFQSQCDQILSVNYSSKISKNKSDLIKELDNFISYYEEIIKKMPKGDKKSLTKSDCIFNKYLAQISKFGTPEEIRKMILQQSHDQHQLLVQIKSLRTIILDHLYCSGPWENSNNKSEWQYWSLIEYGNIYGLHSKLIRNYQGSSYKECIVRSIVNI